MRNSYEMPEVLELGRTQEQILGCKPPDPWQNDAILGLFHKTIPEPCDIDESDD